MCYHYKKHILHSAKHCSIGHLNVAALPGLGLSNLLPTPRSPREMMDLPLFSARMLEHAKARGAFGDVLSSLQGTMLSDTPETPTLLHLLRQNTRPLLATPIHPERHGHFHMLHHSPPIEPGTGRFQSPDWSCARSSRFWWKTYILTGYGIPYAAAHTHHKTIPGGCTVHDQQAHNLYHQHKQGTHLTGNFPFYPNGRSTVFLHQRNSFLFSQSLYHPRRAYQPLPRSAWRGVPDRYPKEAVHQKVTVKRTASWAWHTSHRKSEGQSAQ